MTKDEALDLALEALEALEKSIAITMANIDLRNKAITAIKQARSAPVCNPHPKAPHGFNRSASHSADRYVCDCEGWDAYDAGYQAGIEDTYKRMDALDKKAENARELGLDYEPADGTQVSKVWWDGEKLMAKPIPLVDFYQPMQDSTCNETLRAQGKAYPRTCRKCGKGPCIGAPKPPPTQPAPVQSCYCPNCEAMGKELAALKAQPAPVQEPVAQAWAEGYRAGIDDERTSEANIGIAGMGMKVEPARNNPYHTTPPAQPAPVQEPALVTAARKVMEEFGTSSDGLQELYQALELYTTPPAAQRQWVGLTPHERMMCRSYDIDTAIDKTEAKLKEKNT
jgi:hypothetical protein